MYSHDYDIDPSRIRFRGISWIIDKDVPAGKPREVGNRIYVHSEDEIPKFDRTMNDDPKAR